MRMCIEVADRKLLHPLEHLIADILQRSLSGSDHDPVVDQGGNDTGQIDDSHDGQGFEETSEYRRRGAKQRRDVVIDQRFEKHRRYGADDGADQDADDSDDQLLLIWLHEGQ